MKHLVIALLAGVVGVVLWRVMSEADDRSSAMDRLRASIDSSSLPGRARQEMQALLDQRRLRPSQYLDASG
jgi:hypothetical protein